MFIELLDTLRCISDHPQIPLVTAISRREERFVVDGMSGCPSCRREYPIVSGSVWFCSRDAANRDFAAGPHDPDGALRVGALLAATEGVSVALVGEWARYASELAVMIDLRVFAVNPCDELGESERVGIVHADRRLPFADASMRGVAIGEDEWSDGEIALAVRALAPGGRIVAPVSGAVPGEIVELARDEHVWVGEKRGPLVALHRR